MSCLNKKGGRLSSGEPEGLSCFAISNNSASVTELNSQNDTASVSFMKWLLGLREIVEDVQVMFCLRSLIMFSKKNRNSSHDGDATPRESTIDGFKVTFIILKRVFGLEQFLLIMFDRCRHLAFYTSFW